MFHPYCAFAKPLRRSKEGILFYLFTNSYQPNAPTGLVNLQQNVTAVNVYPGFPKVGLANQGGRRTKQAVGGNKLNFQLLIPEPGDYGGLMMDN